MLFQMRKKRNTKKSQKKMKSVIKNKWMIQINQDTLSKLMDLNLVTTTLNLKREETKKNIKLLKKKIIKSYNEEVMIS